MIYVTETSFFFSCDVRQQISRQGRWLARIFMVFSLIYGSGSFMTVSFIATDSCCYTEQTHFYGQFPTN